MWEVDQVDIAKSLPPTNTNQSRRDFDWSFGPNKVYTYSVSTQQVYKRLTLRR